MPPLSRMRNNATGHNPNKEWSAYYYNQKSKYSGTLIITEVSYISA